MEPQEQAQVIQLPTHVQHIPITEVHPAPDNQRRDVGDVRGLADSIRTHGILEPLTVRPIEGGYELLSGERRLAAARLAELATVPAIVRDVEGTERLEMMLISNIQRANLSPLEEAEAFQQLLDLGLSQHDVARRLGRNAEQIDGRRALLALPKAIRKQLADGALTVGEAQLLTQLTDTPSHLKAALGRVRGGWPVALGVRDQLREREREQKTAATRTSLEERGVTILDAPGKDVMRIGKGFGEVDVKLAAHAKEPCHAATIDRWSGEAIYLCTEPKRHRREDPQAAAAAKAQRAARREATKSIREAATLRVAAMRALLAGGMPDDAVIDHILTVALHDAPPNAAKVACELLEIMPADGTYPDHAGLLRKRVVDRALALRTAVLALSLGSAEAAMRAQWPSRRDAAKVQSHLNALAAHGSYTRTTGDHLVLEKFGVSQAHDGTTAPEAAA